VTVLSFEFGVEVFWLVVWFTSLNAKTDMVYHLSGGSRAWYVLMMLPPLAMPLFFCTFMTCAEACCSSLCWRPRRRHRTCLRRLTRCEDESSHPEDEGSGTSQDSSQTSSSTGGSSSEDESGRCCSSFTPPRVPLALSAVIVALLTVYEGVCTLFWMYRLGWTKGFIMGLLLKLSWLRLCSCLCMTVIRSSGFQHMRFYLKPLELWLFSMSMARDLMVSSLIFWGLAPLVLVSGLSGLACPTWSFHHLLIYRQPGHTSRDDESVGGLPYSDSSSEESTSDASADVVEHLLASACDGGGRCICQAAASETADECDEAGTA